MSTITRERAKEFISNPASLVSAEESEILALARIALASLEAEPVCYLTWHQGFRAPDDCEEYVVEAKPGDKSCDGSPAFPVYTAPPATVSVPDELYQQLSEVYHAQEKRLFKLAQRIKGPSFDKYAHSPSQAIDALESALFGESEDFCRAAMLQGAENAESSPSNSPVIPDGWVACSERMPEGMTDVHISNGHDVGEGWWDGDTWQTQHDYYSVPGDVTHWMPLPAAPQQEVK